MAYFVRAAGKEFVTDVRDGVITVDGQKLTRGATFADGSFEIIIGSSRKRAFFAGNKTDEGGAGEVYIDNLAIPLEIEPEKVRRAYDILGVKAGKITSEVIQLHAPMPGLITKILVQESSTVSIGERLCVLEAMKMENEIRSTVNGIITKLYIKEHDAVEKGKVLIVIKLT